MRYENQTLAIFAQSSKYAEESFYFGRRKSRRWFVENNNTRAGKQHSAKFYELLQAKGEAGYSRRGDHVDAEAAQVICRRPCHSLTIHDPEPRCCLRSEE